MTVAYDATSTKSQGGGGSSSWTHTPTGTPAGVVVVIARTDNTSASAVTYGGVAMTEVPLSPVDTSVVGGAEAYFLGTGIPTGAQTVAVTAVGVTAWLAACFTVTAAADTEIEDTTAVQSNSVTNPSGTLTIASTSFMCAAANSGANTTGEVVAGTNTTLSSQVDWGSDTGHVGRATILSATNFTYGWTINSNNFAGILVAVTETAAPSAVGGSQAILIG